MIHGTGLQAFAPTESPIRRDDSQLRAALDKLESNFLAEMLRSAGVGAPRDGFGGGVGEEHFASFLVSAQADALVAAGGIGLAESIFRSMQSGSPDD
jgi:peptidoglycan hydrolase FlgJ